MMSNVDSGVQLRWVEILVLFFSSCVTLGKSPHISVPRCCFNLHERNNRHTWLMWC